MASLNITWCYVVKKKIAVNDLQRRKSLEMSFQSLSQRAFKITLTKETASLLTGEDCNQCKQQPARKGKIKGDNSYIRGIEQHPT